MNVTLVVDALGPQLSGIGRYVWELCQRVPVQTAVNSAHFYCNGHFIEDPKSLLDPGARYGRGRLPRWARRWMAQRRLKASLVHGPNYFLPPEADRGVVTVHDLSVFRYPEAHPAERLKSFERQFDSSLARAAHVITDSEIVRREVIADFGLTEERVTAIPLAAGSEYHPRSAEELRKPLRSLGLEPGGYALCVSTFEPRKKIAELLRAWRILPDELRNSTPLVLAGAKGWLNEQLHEEIRDAAVAGWLKHLGFVPEAILPSVYAGARLFAYPSIYEGFGLPPVEAMASGVPTLVANRSCLPETCGDAAGYIDPDDVTGFSAAIAKALSDPAWRSRARERGLERAAGYSWERCAAETVQVYRAVFR